MQHTCESSWDADHIASLTTGSWEQGRGWRVVCAGYVFAFVGDMRGKHWGKAETLAELVWSQSTETRPASCHGRCSYTGWLTGSPHGPGGWAGQGPFLTPCLQRMTMSPREVKKLVQQPTPQDAAPDLSSKFLNSKFSLQGIFLDALSWR